MTRRHLIHVLLITLIIGLTSARVASACSPTVWVYDAAQLPSCVTLMSSGVHDFDVYNDCPDSLTLAVSGCPTCTVPDTIPPDDVGTLSFGAPPDPEGSSIDVDWDSGDASGSAAFSLPINRCPGPNGCSAVPGSPTGAAWALVTLLALSGLRRARRPRR